MSRDDLRNEEGERRKILIRFRLRQGFAATSAIFNVNVRLVRKSMFFGASRGDEREERGQKRFIRKDKAIKDK